MDPLQKRTSIPLKESKLSTDKKVSDIEAKDNRQFLEGLKLVDTIRLRYNVKVDPDQLQKCKWKRETVEDFEKGWVHRGHTKVYESTNGNKITVIYVPRDFTKKPNLSIELSLLKVATGNNYEVRPGEIDPNKVNLEFKAITDQIGIAPLDIYEGVITRIDIAQNFMVNDKVKDYIRYLNNCYYPRRTRDAFLNQAAKAKNKGENNGVSFSGKHKVTKAYDKQKESGIIESEGILRLETSFVRTQAVAGLFGKQNPKFSDINRSICRSALQEEMKLLGLDRPLLNKKSCLESIRQMVIDGIITKGMMAKLAIFYSYTQEYPNLNNQQLAEAILVSIDKIQDYRKLLAAGGIRGLDTLTETLPALSLDNPEPFKNGGKALSNTSEPKNLPYGETMPREPGQPVGSMDPNSIRSLIWAYRLCVKTKKVPFIFRGSARVPPGMLPWPPSIEKWASPVVKYSTQPDLANGEVPSRRSVIEVDSSSKSSSG